jgi:DNA-binding protein HU-beta
MTKVELVKGMVEETGMTSSVCLSALEAFMTVTKKNMTKGRNIYLRGFGTFELKQRASKLGRDISRNKSVFIPAHKLVTFKPCKEFKDAAK